MYICICNAITDKDIRQAVSEDGCKCLNTLQKCLPVGNQCGSCCCSAEQLVEDTLKTLNAAPQVA